MKKFDLTTIYNEKRPLSWSAISSFEWNAGQWYRKYVLKELPEETPELRFGKMIDLKLQDDPSFLPEVPRYSLMQHNMRATFDGIPLVGVSDTYKPPLHDSFTNKRVNIPAIRDYKTGRRPWDQTRADETGQLTMYLGLLWLRDKIRPEDVECYIDWLPTHYVDKKIALIEPVKVRTFKTKRTMHEVLTFMQRIKDTWNEMEDYAARQASMEVHDIKEWK